MSWLGGTLRFTPRGLEPQPVVKEKVALQGVPSKLYTSQRIETHVGTNYRLVGFVCILIVWVVPVN